MNKTTEALKLSEEALLGSGYYDTTQQRKALASIREARAEQATVSGGLCGGCAKKAADGWALYCVECWEQAEKEPVAFHRASFLSGYEAAQSDANACDVPPQGWLCTRQAGHDGPCAAIEDNNGHEMVSRAMSRLAEQDAAHVRTKDLTDDEIVEALGYDKSYRLKRWVLDDARAVIAADREKNK